MIRDCYRRIQKLQAGQKPDDGSGSGDPEHRIEELKNIVRKAETDKCKAQSRLDALKEGGSESFSRLFSTHESFKATKSAE